MMCNRMSLPGKDAAQVLLDILHWTVGLLVRVCGKSPAFRTTAGFVIQFDRAPNVAVRRAKALTFVPW